MGGLFSSNTDVFQRDMPKKKFGSLLLPLAVVHDLDDLDVVLIRSKVTLTGVSLDPQVARRINASTNQKSFENSYTVDKWDRVGIIGIPEWKDDTDRCRYKLKDITVTEATHDGIKTSTLEDICENALDVSIRRMRFVGDHIQRDIARKKITGRDFLAPGEEEQARLAKMAKWYPFVGKIINRPYIASKTFLEPMFKHVLKHLVVVHKGPDDQKALSALFSMRDHTGDGLDLDEYV
jgi:hypothetical protein